MGDWQKSLGNKLDYPESHLVIAGSALALRNFPAVLQAFQEVVRLDPQRADAWVMLVRITDATQGQPQARQVLLRALDKVPSDPGLMRLMGQIGR